MIGKIKKFLEEVKVELKKVRWPTKEETVRMTLVVIGTSIGMGAFLGIIDFIFAKLLGLII